MVVLVAAIAIGAAVYGATGALVGYVVGLIGGNLIPDASAGAGCALPPERPSSPDESPPSSEA